MLPVQLPFGNFWQPDGMGRDRTGPDTTGHKPTGPEGTGPDGPDVLVALWEA